MSWNPNDEEKSESREFQLLPKGLYKVVIEKCETKISDHDHSRVGVTMMMTVIDYNLETPSSYKNRKVFSYFTWSHPNEVAVKMGRKKLADILFAAGKVKQYSMPGEFAAELLGEEVFVNVIQKKRSDTGEMKNEIEGVFNAKMQSRANAFKPLSPILDVQAQRPQLNEVPPPGDDDAPF